MKKLCLLLTVVSCQYLTAQLYIAPGDSISVLPGTLFTLQEGLENNGRIYNNGVLTLNGTLLQTLSGIGGSIDNLTVDNNALLVSDQVVNNAVLINAGQLLDLGNVSLTNGGSINGAGFIKGSSLADLILNGSGNSILQFDQSNDASSNALKSISFNGVGAVFAVQNRLYVYDVMEPSAGTVTLNDEVILRSTNSNTARVAPVGSTLLYGTNGKFVIERYIPGNRAWRLLTAPVTPASQEKISGAWQDHAPRVTNVNVINAFNNPRPGYGTHITFGYPAGNGYDQGVNGNTSIRYLNATGWNGIPTATNDGGTLNSGYINDQPGYMLFVRGDRGTLLWQATASATSSTVLRPKGKINTGTINHPLTAAYDNGLGSVFRVIGNPYPSPISFHDIATNPVNIANGFADAFYIWDPNITGTNGVGGFVGMSYNAAASIAAGHPVYDRTVLSGGSSSIDNSGIIPSGSAFLIDYSGAATSLRMDESDKATVNNLSFFRGQNQLSTHLLAVNADGTISVNDGVLATFDDDEVYTAKRSHLFKLSNFAEGIALKHRDKQAAILQKGSLLSSDTLFYQLSKLKQKRYQLQFVWNNVRVPTGTAAMLEDLFLQSKYILPLNDTSSYAFTVSADRASFDSNRFRIVFKPVNQFITLQALAVDQDIQLYWVLKDTLLPDHFIVERSDDAGQFSPVAQVGAMHNGWKDEQCSPGTYYYRVKAVNQQGIITYSEVVSVTMMNDASGLYVYPNPVTSGNIQIRMSRLQAGSYQWRLLDNAGKLIRTGLFVHAGGTLQKTIEAVHTLSNGIYQLELLYSGKQVTRTAVAVKNPL